MAASALGASGLKVSTSTQTSATRPRTASSSRQSPKAGTTVAAGDTVTLTIGKFSGTTTPTTPTTPTTTTPTTPTTPTPTTPTTPAP